MQFLLNRRLITAIVLISLTLMAVGSSALAMSSWRLVPVLSGSMSPLMSTGDLAVTHPANIGDVKVGDVIVYSAPSPKHPLMMHRVVSIETVGTQIAVKTKGDSNAQADGWIAHFAPNATVQKRETSVAYVGRVVHFAAAVGTSVLLLMGAVILISFYLLGSLWHAPEQSDEDSIDAAMAT